jgi:hypothetical protein
MWWTVFELWIWEAIYSYSNLQLNWIGGKS